MLPIHYMPLKEQAVHARVKEIMEQDHHVTRISMEFLRTVNGGSGLPKFEMPKIELPKFEIQIPFRPLELGHLEVHNLENKRIWPMLVNQEEQDRILQLLKSAETVGLLGAVLRPVRTNTIKNFAKDFFLPTTINRALLVKNLVGKVFAILGALVFDTLTFPLRLASCVPALLMNSNPEDHLFYKYLQEQKVEPNFLKAEHVYVKWTFGDKEQELMLNFFKQPRYEGCDFGKRVVMNEFDLLRNLICLRKG